MQTQPPQPSSLLASALILPQLPLMLPPLSGANPADAAGAGGVATHPALPPLSSSAAGAGGGAAWPAGTLATDLLAQLGNGNNGFGNGFGGGFGFGDGGLMGRGTVSMVCSLSRRLCAYVYVCVCVCVPWLVFRHGKRASTRRD